MTVCGAKCVVDGDTEVKMRWRRANTRPLPRNSPGLHQRTEGGKRPRVTSREGWCYGLRIKWDPIPRLSVGQGCEAGDDGG